MDDLVSIIKKIIEINAGIIPAFIYDKYGIFEKQFDYLKNKEKAITLQNSSKIALQECIRNINRGGSGVIYSKFDINIDAYIASNKLKFLEITPDLLLNSCNEIKDKLRGSFSLSNEQYKIFIDNFDNIIAEVKNNECISIDTLKYSLAKNITGKVNTPKDLFLAFIKGQLNVDAAKKACLYEYIAGIIKNNFNIDIHGIDNNKDLFEKVLITTVLYKNKDDFGPEFNDKLLKVDAVELDKLLSFIKENSYYFEKDILEINKKFKNKSIKRIDYTIPVLFENYIADYIKNYCDINIDKTLLWTDSMKTIGVFINKISYLDKLLKSYISYTFPTNTISEVIKQYKEFLYEIDSVYRETSSLFEDLSYNFKFYIKAKKSKVMDALTEMYFNVIGNINGKYISAYNDIFSNNSDVLRQDDILKKLRFRRDTVFIFADGLRYEMAKEFLNGVDCEEIIDYNVYSLIPTETEVCMNGYFITDEKIKVNAKKVFELTKNDKVILHIIKWRTEKLSEILGCNVVPFEEFKEDDSYEGSVICFYNDVDIVLHKLDSSKKLNTALQELRNIIDYSIGRNFDVMLLSDHGFIDIKKKIEAQDDDLELEKKKGRYLILSSNEKADTMFYKKDIELGGFFDLKDKNICFINSINSLRQTTRYTHGGISLQEIIVTAFLFKANQDSVMQTSHKYIINVAAYNELKADISNARGFECSIFAGTQKIFVTIVSEDNYKLRFPIRNYKKGEEFLIVVTNGELVEKETIRKSGTTVIDEELDIF